jgi:sulfide:quinone oxidoreductase
MVTTPKPRTLIVGGGIAAVEAILALDEVAQDLTEVTLVCPEPDFTYKPLIVEEPFSHAPAEHHELEPLVAERGGSFVRASAESFEPAGHRVTLTDGSDLAYEYLLVCVGGQTLGELSGAETFRVAGEPLEIDSLIDQALAHESRRIAFVAPPGVSWSLPLYELALMTRRLAEESGRDDLRISTVTPEPAPLILFGTVPSEAVTEVLRARRIEFDGDSLAKDEGGGIALSPGDRRLEAGAVIALPMIEGRRLRGLPSDDRGFIPIDQHARIVGVEDAWAAGDGTNFPIKQGGLATQQADAAVFDIARRLGAEVDAEPFHPILRGQLIVGAESLNLRQDVTGGHGEGTVSSDYLWWPPHKVSGRFLSPWLAQSGPHAEGRPPKESIDIELAMPLDWHEEPMTLDPYSPLA